MDNLLRKQLYTWGYNKIKSNPKKFGGDFSISELELQLMNILSMIKNKLLIQNPQFNFWMKNKPKINQITKVSHKKNPTKTADRWGLK